MNHRKSPETNADNGNYVFILPQKPREWGNLMKFESIPACGHDSVMIK